MKQKRLIFIHFIVHINETQLRMMFQMLTIHLGQDEADCFSAWVSAKDAGLALNDAIDQKGYPSNTLFCKKDLSSVTSATWNECICFSYVLTKWCKVTLTTSFHRFQTRIKMVQLTNLNWKTLSDVFKLCTMLDIPFLILVNYGNLLLKALLEGWWSVMAVEDGDCHKDGKDFFKVPKHTPLIFR